MKRPSLFFLAYFLICCADNDPTPLTDDYPLIKTITSYDENSTEPSGVITYTYDDQKRVIKEVNTNSGLFSSGLTTFEYVSDRHIKVTSGSRTYDFHLDERGNVVRWNEDTFSYKYEDNKVTMTITSDSETWDMIYYFEDGNVTRIEDPEDDYFQVLVYDDKPNFRKSIDIIHFYSCENNVTYEMYSSNPDSDPYETENTYVYNAEGYVISYLSNTFRGDNWSSKRRYEIEYY